MILHHHLEIPHAISLGVIVGFLAIGILASLWRRGANGRRSSTDGGAMIELLSDPQTWLAFLTLTALEIVLGIDNIIFISILVGRLPKAQQQRGRTIGLALAMLTRILLLLSITWVMGLQAELFSLGELGVTGRDLILIGGGLFLLAKSTLEIHSGLEGAEHQREAGGRATFTSVIVQIAIIDIVFSLDSVITAVGMVDHVEVMIAAVIVAVLVMMFLARPIGEFVDRHPTIKMLALAFLILIGTALVGRGLRVPHPEGLHLLRDGVLGRGGDAEHPRAQEDGAAEAQEETG
jgi:predicted tellurium resistance membrane protein TerC